MWHLLPDDKVGLTPAPKDQEEHEACKGPAWPSPRSSGSRLQGGHG
jgi:hypothetical protein